MKIAFLAPEFLPTWGGVGTYSAELVKGLCSYDDLDIHVITPKRGEDYDASKIEKYFDDKITIHNISTAKGGFIYNLKFQFSILRNFNKLHNEHKFDLVHSANLVHMPDIFLKFKKLDIPSVTTVHSTLKSQSHVLGERSLKKRDGKKTRTEKLTSLFYPYIKVMESFYLKKTENIITVSQWVKQFVEGKNENCKFAVINNGVDVKRFSKKSKKSKEFSFLDKIDKPIVLFCGRLLALKGLSTLIESIKKLKGEDIFFLFTGPGDVENWEKQLEGVPKKNYKFLDYVPHQKIHHLYAKSDLFVLPSFTESFPLTILEAMASGLPVIASKVGGVPEIIDHNKNGLLVEPGNSEQLAESILRVLKDKKLSKKLSKNARDRVKKNFTLDIMTKRTKEVYDNILQAK